MAPLVWHRELDNPDAVVLDCRYVHSYALPVITYSLFFSSLPCFFSIFFFFEHFFAEELTRVSLVNTSAFLSFLFSPTACRLCLFLLIPFISLNSIYLLGIVMNLMLGSSKAQYRSPPLSSGLFSSSFWFYSSLIYSSWC